MTLLNSSLLVLLFFLNRVSDVDGRSAPSRNSVLNLDFVKFGVAEFETKLTDQDFQRAPGSYKESENDDPDLLYQRDLFEGDILGITKDTIDDFIDEMNAQEALTDYFSKLGDNIRYQAIRDQSRLWLGSEVPYSISSLYTDEGKTAIARAIQTITNNTCIKFVPRTLERDYLFITPKGGGCSSFVGRQRGRQQVQLGPDCLNQMGIILHEFMHSLGFFHEQSRADRDDYIFIKWENIHPLMAPNFRSYRLDYIQHLGADYDFGSVMHYGPYAFTKNGAQTILPMIPNLADEMGQRKRFSRTDIYKLNKLYGCLPREDSTPWPGFIPPEEPTEAPSIITRKTKQPGPPSGLPPMTSKRSTPGPTTKASRMTPKPPGSPMPPSSLPPSSLKPPAPIPPTPTEVTKPPVIQSSTRGFGNPPSIRPQPPGIRPPPLTKSPQPPGMLPVTRVVMPPSVLPRVRTVQPPSILPPVKLSVTKKVVVTKESTTSPLTGPPRPPSMGRTTQGSIGPQPPSGLPPQVLPPAVTLVPPLPTEATIAPDMPKEKTLAPPMPSNKTITPPMFTEKTITAPMPTKRTLTPVIDMTFTPPMTIAPKMPNGFTRVPEIATVTPDQMTITPEIPTITPKTRPGGEDEERTTNQPRGPGPESVLYHPYECFVREDHNKRMHWPETGYPRSDYICIITEDQTAWRGFRYEVRRLTCTWEVNNVECTVQRGQTKRCWNRFNMTCPNST